MGVVPFGREVPGASRQRQRQVAARAAASACLFVLLAASRCAALEDTADGRSWLDDDRGLFGPDTRFRIENKTSATSLGWTLLATGNLLSLIGTVFLIYKISAIPSVREKPQYILMRSYAIFQNFHYVQCGLQCFISLVSDRFMGSALACIVEAVMHQFAFVSFTLMMLVTVYHTYYQVIHLQSWTTTSAVRASYAVGVFSAVVVLLALALPGTEIAMEPVGAFCFYDFRSSGNAGFISAVILGIVGMIVLFGRIYYKVSQILELSGGGGRTTALSLSKLRLRIAASVTAFVIGACPIAASILKSQITQEEPGKTELLIVATCVVNYGLVWTLFVLWSDKKLRPDWFATVLGYSLGSSARIRMGKTLSDGTQPGSATSQASRVGTRYSAAGAPKKAAVAIEVGHLKP